ncbi:MAG: DegV family protein [Gammaproteobacteria bacterium]|nr:DegV family protein [Gammaproteobacteria bacterium]
MKIALSAESTIDLRKDLLEEWDIHTLPFHFNLDGCEYADGDITNGEIFSIVNKCGKTPKTSAVNVQQFTDHFESLKSKGYDAIIHISLSSGISSAYQNAVLASNNFENVYVIDSLSLSTGIALLAKYARDLIDKGLEIDEIVSKVNARREFVQTSFVLYRLDYLYKGGRCSALALFGANLLKLRPQILVINGKMSPAKKFIGEYTKCCKQYAKATLDRFNNYDKSLCFVTYSSYYPEMIEAVKEEARNAGFKRIEETTAGSTITSHCGENCIGILYINNIPE